MFFIHLVHALKSQSRSLSLRSEKSRYKITIFKDLIKTIGEYLFTKILLIEKMVQRAPCNSSNLSKMKHPIH